MGSCQAGITPRLADLHELLAILSIHPVAPSEHVDNEESDSFVERRLLNGRHGTIWTIFRVRKTSVIFLYRETWIFVRIVPCLPFLLLK